MRDQKHQLINTLHVLFIFMTYISIFDVPQAKILIKIKKFEFVSMLELF